MSETLPTNLKLVGYTFRQTGKPVGTHQIYWLYQYEEGFAEIKIKEMLSSISEHYPNGIEIVPIYESLNFPVDIVNNDLINASRDLLKFAMHVKKCLNKNGEYAPLITKDVDDVISRSQATLARASE